MQNSTLQLMRLIHRIFRSYQGSESSFYLNLQQQDVNQQVVKQLCSYPTHRLCFLNLNESKVDNQGMKELVQGNWQNLQYLNLDNNQFTHEGICSLSFVKWPKLQVLNLSTSFDNLCNNLIGAKGMKYISKIITTELCQLKLNKNRIDNQALSHLMKADLSKLKILRLNGNMIKTHFIYVLSKGNLIQLTKLFLSYQKDRYHTLKPFILLNSNKIRNLITECEGHHKKDIMDLQKRFTCLRVRPQQYYSLLHHD